MLHVLFDRHDGIVRTASAAAAAAAVKTVREGTAASAAESV